mgnify:FL=1
MTEETKTPIIALCPCISSQISHLGYDKDTQTLALKFKHGGSVYRYDSVPPALYEELCKAESVGAFFGKHIKPHADRYPFKKQVVEKTAE